MYHTGIIVDWNEDGLDVVEGNTNGGMVALKHYSYSDSKIDGVGRPRYDGWELESDNSNDDNIPEPAPEPTPEPAPEPEDIVLLREIRDLLKKDNSGN